MPAPRPSRAELPAACGPGGRTYTHGGTAWQPPMPRPGRPNRGPQALWIPGAPGDRVSAAAARRRRCGDTRECRGTGGSGWSGTCGDRVGGWSAWGGGPLCPSRGPGAPGDPAHLLQVGLAHPASVSPPGPRPLTPPAPHPPGPSPGRVGLHGEGPLDVDRVPLVLERAVAQGHLEGEGGVGPGGDGAPRPRPRLATWPQRADSLPAARLGPRRTVTPPHCAPRNEGRGAVSERRPRVQDKARRAWSRGVGLKTNLGESGQRV